MTALPCLVQIVLADANFPAASIAHYTPGGLINADGNDIPTLLTAIMELLPLDETEAPAILMGMVRPCGMVLPADGLD
jgi:L-fucose mutarotase/ribose pyranase (RbsD/FucU family)